MPKRKRSRSEDAKTTGRNPLQRPQKRGRYELDEEARETGRNLFKRQKRGKPPPKFDTAFGPKPETTERFVEKGSYTPKKDSAINRAYRASWKAMDELFSTALTRELFKGAAESGFQGQEWERLVELVDLASTARISTHFSGFATKDRVMQHPTSRTKAIFADPYDTASLHSSMDTARRTYVQDAMNAAGKANGTAEEVISAGVRASIEFTLNYFTAPITAENVFKYSRRGAGGNSAFSRADQRQLAERERLKVLYQRIGGRLRKAAKKESRLQSRTRAWQRDLKPKYESSSFPQAPPSPRREPDLPNIELQEFGL